MIDLYF